MLPGTDGHGRNFILVGYVHINSNVSHPKKKKKKKKTPMLFKKKKKKTKDRQSGLQGLVRLDPNILGSYFPFKKIEQKNWNQ